MKKLNPYLLPVLCFLSLLGFTSCDNDDDDAPAANPTPAKMTAAEFMTRAAASDTFEITTGNLAKMKGMHNEVKTFGDTLVKDHTMTSMELKALAKAKNVTLPKTIPADKQAMIADLSGRSNQDFDRRFADVQIQAHNEAIALFQQAINEVEDAQVKAFATKHLPHLQMHLARATRLKTKLQ